MVRMISAAAAIALALAGTPAAADVSASGDNGFATTDSAEVAASPDAVWAALINPATWWNGNHSWSGDAANFRLDPRAGGCFCENLPDGGSVEHLRVVYVQPDRMLRMSGALGPLQSEALSGALTVTLEPTDGGGTRIVWDYVVAGFARYDLAALSPVVDRVQTEQLTRLAARVSGALAE